MESEYCQLAIKLNSNSDRTVYKMHFSPYTVIASPK